MGAYDPLFSRRERDDSDLDQARQLFARASRPYLRTPWSWCGWAVVLPAGALATNTVAARWGLVGVLFLWTAVIVVGGVGEAAAILRPGGLASTGLAQWVLRSQGNLSLIAVALSITLVVVREAWALPAVWLLLLGHSFFAYGGLALPAIRWAGVIYQLGGVAALLPGTNPLWAMAIATALGNLWIARAVYRERRQ